MRLHIPAAMAAAALSLTMTILAGDQPATIAIEANAFEPLASRYRPAVRPIITFPERGPSFESIASSDFFIYDGTPPDPSIAVGPEDILVVTNRAIYRHPNPTSQSSTPGVSASARQFLDVWVGEAALNALCPTFPRSLASCHFDYAAVRYDQLQGRFLVLIAVADNLASPGQPPIADRKASWVLLVSRSSSLAGPAVFPTATTADASNPWSIWYGDALNGPGTDGFGNPVRPGTVGSGNINSAPAVEGAQGNPFDCRTTAVAASDSVPTSVCYMPSGARIGFDNEVVILSSPVYNDNINPADRSEIFDTDAAGGISFPAYAGTRVRVIKKSRLYSSPPGTGHALTAGNQFAGALNSAAASAHYYDIYSNNLGAPSAATPPTPYTIVASATEPAQNLAVTPGTPGQVTPNRLSPLFCEPQTLRGRALATFSSAPARSALKWATDAHLLCAISTPSTVAPAPLQSLYGLTLHRPRTQAQAATELSRFVVHGLSGTTLPATDDGAAKAEYAAYPAAFGTIPHRNASTVPQRDRLAGGVAPRLFAGDNRPRAVIASEGRLYSAQTIGAGQAVDPDATAAFQVTEKSSGAPFVLSLHISYGAPIAMWAPMHDVPFTVAALPSDLPYYSRTLLGAATTRNLFTSVPATVPGNCAGTALSDFIWPSLMNFRCGEDAYDTLTSQLNPATGVSAPTARLSLYGDADVDPNDGSLWYLGAYAKTRLASLPGFGQWGTFAANFRLEIPSVVEYPDLPFLRNPLNPWAAEYNVERLYIHSARELGIVPPAAPGAPFSPDAVVSREEMAYWLMRSQMDEQAIDDFLAGSGGTFTSFADVPTSSPFHRYIETMYRLGYTPGCGAGNDGQRRFCPTLPATASTVGLLIMRAKNAQVEPSILTTCTSAALRGPIGVASLHPPLQCGGTRTDFNIRRREMAVLMMRAFFQ